MNGYRRGPTLSRIVFGLILVALGVFFTLENLHVGGVHEYVKYWPVLLIVFGLAKILDPYRGGRFFGSIIAVLGVIFLLKSLGTVDWSLKDLWPLLLALLGLNILWHAFWGRSVWSRRRHRRFRVTIDGPRGRERVVWMPRGSGGADPGSGATGAAEAAASGETEGGSSEPLLDVHAFFGETKRVITAQNFRGGSVNVSMGSVKLDLRQAVIAGDEAVLDVRTVMGGVEIRVPETWNVVVHTNSVLGGVDDSTHGPAAGGKKLILTGDVFMGGIEVKN
jgi:hypothetical protein